MVARAKSLAHSMAPEDVSISKDPLSDMPRPRSRPSRTSGSGVSRNILCNSPDIKAQCPRTPVSSPHGPPPGTLFGLQGGDHMPRQRLQSPPPQKLSAPPVLSDSGRVRDVPGPEGRALGGVEGNIGQGRPLSHPRGGSPVRRRLRKGLLREGEGLPPSDPGAEEHDETADDGLPVPELLQTRKAEALVRLPLAPRIDRGGPPGPIVLPDDVQASAGRAGRPRLYLTPLMAAPLAPVRGVRPPGRPNKSGFTH